MKSYYYLLIALLLTLGFIACSDDENEANAIGLIVEEVHFKAKGGETLLEPKSSEPISVVTKDDWIETRVEDNKVLVKVSSFFSAKDRIGYIEVISGGSHKTVKILQLSTYKFKMAKTNEVAASMKVGGESKVSIENTFPNEDPSRFITYFEDESDKDWVEATLANDNTALNVKVSPNPTGKPKDAILYLVVKGDLEETVTDTVIVKSTYMADDLLGKWQATYNSPETSHEVEIVQEEKDGVKIYYLEGFSLRTNKDMPIRLPVEFDSTKRSWAITMGGYLGEFENKYAYTALRTVTNSGGGYTWWRLNNAPRTYPSVISIDDESSKITANFPDFNVGDSVAGGFVLRLFNTHDILTSSSSSTRSILSLKLEKLH